MQTNHTLRNPLNVHWDGWKFKTSAPIDDADFVSYESAKSLHEALKQAYGLIQELQNECIEVEAEKLAGIEKLIEENER